MSVFKSPLNPKHTNNELVLFEVQNNRQTAGSHTALTDTTDPDGSVREQTICCKARF